MLTRIFFALLLFLIPFLVYLGYVKLKRRAGATLDSEEITPWLMLITAGLVLATAGVIAIGVFFDHDAGVVLRPPAFVDGEIVPGGPVEQPE